MSSYVLSPLARQDLEQIWDRIAEDDFDAADRVVEEIRNAILRLSTRPLIGHVRRDLAPPDIASGRSTRTSSSTVPTRLPWR